MVNPATKKKKPFLIDDKRDRKYFLIVAMECSGFPFSDSTTVITPRRLLYRGKRLFVRRKSLSIACIWTSSRKRGLFRRHKTLWYILILTPCICHRCPWRSCPT